MILEDDFTVIKNYFLTYCLPPPQISTSAAPLFTHLILSRFHIQNPLRKLFSQDELD